MSEFTYAFSEDEWVRVATRLKWRVLRWFWLAAALLAVFAVWTMSSYFDLIMPAIVFAALAGSWLFARRNTRKIYREQPSIGDQKSFRVLPESMEVEGRTGVTRLPWNEVLKWTDIGGDLYLYINRAMTIPIPASAGPDNLASVRARLANSGLPTANKRRK